MFTWSTAREPPAAMGCCSSMKDKATIASAAGLGAKAAVNGLASENKAYVADHLQERRHTIPPKIEVTAASEISMTLAADEDEHVILSQEAPEPNYSAAVHKVAANIVDEVLAEVKDIRAAEAVVAEVQERANEALDEGIEVAMEEVMTTGLVHATDASAVKSIVEEVREQVHAVHAATDEGIEEMSEEVMSTGLVHTTDMPAISSVIAEVREQAEDHMKSDSDSEGDADVTDVIDAPGPEGSLHTVAVAAAAAAAAKARERQHLDLRPERLDSSKSRKFSQIQPASVDSPGAVKVSSKFTMIPTGNHPLEEKEEEEGAIGTSAQTPDERYPSPLSAHHQHKMASRLSAAVIEEEEEEEEEE